MTSVPELVLNALALGGTYALVTLGLAILFSVMRIINFAHGMLVTIGGYIIFFTAELPWIWQALLVVMGTAVVSVLLERTVFSRLGGADGNTLLVASFAVSYFFQNLLFSTIGSRPRALSIPDFLTGTLSINELTVNKADMVTIAIVTASLLAVRYVFQRTVFGLRIRAVAEDAIATETFGIASTRVLIAAFALSGGLAGLASLFYLSRGALVTPTIGNNLILVAFVAIVLGGLGSLTGAVAGGFILGAASVLLQASLPNVLVEYRDAFLFALVVVLLLLRPNGLFAPKGDLERV